MRALLLLGNLGFLGLTYAFTSFNGLLLTMAACGGLSALLVAYSTNEGRNVSRRSTGGASTFIAPLTQF